MPIITRPAKRSSNVPATGKSSGSSSDQTSTARRRKASVSSVNSKKPASSKNSASGSEKSGTKDEDDAFLDEMVARADAERKNMPAKHNDKSGNANNKRRSRKQSVSKSHNGSDSSLTARLLHFWTTRKFIFLLGAIIGLAFAGYFTANSQDIGLSLDILQDLSLSDMIDDFKGKLPIGIVKEASNLEKQHDNLSEPFKIGFQLRDKENLQPFHPVIMVPGVTSTGLESWSLDGTAECPTKPYFRKRLWGSWHMLRTMLLDKNCWLKNLMLDDETGLDPPHFKIRAAQGLDSADFFVTGYWIWGRILENLAAIGYDSANMMVASYDWRLSYENLEVRDRYFSKLKMTIEDLSESTGQKTVFMGHSMGSQVLFYFLKWVEATGQGFGNGGPTWVNDHIEAVVDISGSTLGTPKAIVALLSGEMKDTVQLNSMAVYGLEKFFSRRERADLLRSFGGLASMLPKGGETVWGNLQSAPDDYANQTDTFGNFIRFKHPKSELSSHNLTIPDSIEYLMSQSDRNFVRKTKDSYSYGLAKSRKQVQANERDPVKWTNPLEAALPHAPDMKMYCFYGVGKPTERSYYYKEEENKNLTHLNVTIAGEDPNAVLFGEGDGTVALVTHTMCHKWKDAGSKFNPGNVKVKIVEMAHEPDNYDIRGGAKTADHVDILGRAELNELVLRVAAGQGMNITERIFSPLKKWAEKMDFGSD